MSIYYVDGTQSSSAYDKAGPALQVAYDIGANVVFTSHFSLKVMSYNVGQWYLGNHDNVPASLDQAYYELQNGMIERNSPDILILQEYTKQFSKTGRTAKSILQQYYPYIQEQSGDNPTASVGDGRCIASKFPISEYTVHTYSKGTALKYFDSCIVTVNGIRFMVIVTHLHWSTLGVDEIRAAQARELAAFASQHQNVIIGGDFNTGIRPNDTAESRESKYNYYVKPFIDAGMNTANFDTEDFVTCIDGLPNVGTSYCLDNIYSSPNLAIFNVSVDTTKITDEINEKVDHMPLIAEVEI